MLLYLAQSSNSYLFAVRNADKETPAVTIQPSPFLETKGLFCAMSLPDGVRPLSDDPSKSECSQNSAL